MGRELIVHVSHRSTYYSFLPSRWFSSSYLHYLTYFYFFLLFFVLFFLVCSFYSFYSCLSYLYIHSCRYCGCEIMHGLLRFNQKLWVPSGAIDPDWRIIVSFSRSRAKWSLRIVLCVLEYPFGLDTGGVMCWMGRVQVVPGVIVRLILLVRRCIKGGVLMEWYGHTYA